MRTSIDIPDALFRKLKKRAADEAVTLKQLVIDAVQQRLEGKAPSRRKFKYKDFSVKGEGLQGGLQEGDWETTRAMIYEGHGG